MNTTYIDAIAGSGCLDLLRNDGIDLTKGMESALTAYLDLVRRWNDVASLVSTGDLERLVDVHLVDSMSLVPVIRMHASQEGRLVDIGSGGGLPAIPVKIVLPDLELTLVERSERKVGFLRKVISALKLLNVSVYHGEFPHFDIPVTADVITARAVEKPEKVARAILSWMPDTAVFLCQSGTAAGKLGDAFHVERVEDEWGLRGYRRGDLFLITKSRQ